MDPRATFQQIRQLKLTQDDLKKRTFEAGSGEIKVIIGGDLKVREIKLPSKITPTVLKSFKTALNTALTKAQNDILNSVKKII